jgi:hypothetical protein
VLIQSFEEIVSLALIFPGSMSEYYAKQQGKWLSPKMMRTGCGDPADHTEVTRNIPNTCIGRIVDANVARRRLAGSSWEAELSPAQLAALVARHGERRLAELQLLLVDAEAISNYDIFLIRQHDEHVLHQQPHRPRQQPGLRGRGGPRCNRTCQTVLAADENTMMMSEPKFETVFGFEVVADSDVVAMCTIAAMKDPSKLARTMSLYSLRNVTVTVKCTSCDSAMEQLGLPVFDIAMLVSSFPLRRMLRGLGGDLLVHDLLGTLPNFISFG